MQSPVQEETPPGFFQKLSKSAKGVREDHPTKVVLLYTAFSAFLIFLLVASFAPYLGQRLGFISQKKEKQQSFAQETNKPSAIGKGQSPKIEKPQGAASRPLQASPQAAPPKEKGRILKSPAPRKIKGELFGQVVDAASDAPLGGAEVLVENQYFKAKTSTDSNGDYQILDIPAGKYAVIVQKSGYSTQKKPLILPSGETLVINFNLDQ